MCQEISRPTTEVATRSEKSDDNERGGIDHRVHELFAYESARYSLEAPNSLTILYSIDISEYQ